MAIQQYKDESECNLRDLGIYFVLQPVPSAPARNYRIIAFFFTSASATSQPIHLGSFLARYSVALGACPVAFHVVSCSIVAIDPEPGIETPYCHCRHYCSIRPGVYRLASLNPIAT